MDKKERALLLHQKALQVTQRYFLAESELLGVLQEMDRDRSYQELKYRSLFAYAVEALKLSESTALNFINVARKAVQVPVLKQEIADGLLSVCKARKIVPVLTAQNQEEWIQKAKTLSTRTLEKEVARIVPQAAQPERVRTLSEDRVGLSLSLDEKTMETIRRVQDLESQRRKCAVTLEGTLAAMSGFYLEKNDPVLTARRLEAKREAKQESKTEPKLELEKTYVTGQVGEPNKALPSKPLPKKPLPKKPVPPPAQGASCGH